jgi:hypothetical protein
LFQTTSRLVIPVVVIGEFEFGIRPINDTCIAAVARHERLPTISRDGHFDAVSGVERVSW